MATYDLNLNADKNRDYYNSDRRELLDYIPLQCARSVEFGCGTGEFSALLKTVRNTEPWAVEIYQESAQKAAAKLDRVINADALESLSELPDGYFDCAIFLDVPEHLVDPYALLKSIKAKLKPGGLVVCSIPNIRYYRAFSKYVFKGDWNYEEHGIMDKTHVRFFTRKSILKTVSEHRYDILRLNGIHQTSSRTYWILNTLLWNTFEDVRYKYFVVTATPDSR